ncbi:histone H2A.N [Rhynchocyon petersi]
MYYICLNDLAFPKKKRELPFSAQTKCEWVDAALGKKRRKRKKKKESHFCYMGQILKQIHPDFNGCSWVLSALGSLDDLQLELLSLEAARLSFYNHRRAITSKEILEAMKPRFTQRSF